MQRAACNVHRPMQSRCLGGDALRGPPAWRLTCRATQDTMLQRSAASCRRTTMRCTRRRSLWARKVPQPPQLSPNPLGGHLLGTVRAKTSRPLQPLAALGTPAGAGYSAMGRKWPAHCTGHAAGRGAVSYVTRRVLHVACCTLHAAGRAAHPRWSGRSSARRRTRAVSASRTLGALRAVARRVLLARPRPPVLHA